MATALKSLEETRQRIIDAAAERFSRFGYGKTNVAEIARDCRMSPGNLYRYFRNKAEIAESIMREGLEDVLGELRAVLGSRKMAASEQLRSFLMRELHHTYRQLETFPTLLEQVRDPEAHGPLLAEEYLNRSRKLMSEILASGASTGEFNIDDADATARYIQAATLKFRYPQMHTDIPLNELEQTAKGVIDLLLKGLRAS
ncbi:MAG: TetR/AcrR family transcriptional regulator [Alphaproteobacteria bacterium]